MNNFGLDPREIKRIIDQRLKLDKLPHTILIYGLPGIGKSHLCQEIANSIIGYPNSKSISATHSPDLYIVAQDEKIITIEEVRNIKIWLQMTAIQSTYKILLIHNLDRMNLNACNAFLKLLEEPVGKTFIMLNTAKIALLPKTIISRCLKLRLCKPNINNFKEIISLKSPLSKKADLGEIYNICEGNINFAKSMLENNIYFIDNDKEIINKLEKLDLNSDNNLNFFNQMVQKLLANLIKRVLIKQQHRTNLIKIISQIEDFINNINNLNKNTAKTLILSLLNQCIAK